MKTIIFSALLASALACNAVHAQNTPTMQVNIVDNQDIKQYVKKTTGTLDIKTSNGIKNFWAFQSQYILTSNDFKNEAQDGVILPIGAKLTGMKVQGYNRGGAVTTLKTQAWAQSVEDSFELEYKQGYKNNPNPSDEFEYTNGVIVNSFSPTSTKDNPDNIGDLSFKKPYIYDGKAILVTLFQWYDGEAPMKFGIMTTTCEKKVGNVIRTGNYSLSAQGAYFKGFRNIFAQKNPAYVVPAFTLDYYTNDLRGEVEGATGAMVKLYDIDAQQYVTADGATALNGDNACPVNADGKFSYTNLNYTHSYKLTVTSGAGTVEKTLNFDGESTATPTAGAVKNDLNVKVVM